VDQFRDASDAGYNTVINLAPDGLETSLPNERDIVEALRMNYRQIPVIWSEPRIDQLELFEDLLEALRGRRMLIHCQANYRVTAFFAMYAISKLGWSEGQANALIARIWGARPDFQMDETWRRFIATARERAAWNSN
jgi:protein tyrosine phosphatase (PTP) superfamily phosphohydrolase (DUF442 family)